MNLEHYTSEIIAKILSSQEEGIKMCYDRYGSVLLGSIYRIVGDREISEEVLQDVFLKIWKNIDKFDQQKGSFFTWINKISRNTSLDYLKSKHIKRRSVTNSLSESLGEHIDNSGGPFSVDPGIVKAIDSLDQKYIHLIEEHYYLGYSQAELAKKNDMPIGTVKTRLRTAITKLRKILEVDLMVFIYFIIEQFNN